MKEPEELVDEINRQLAREYGYGYITDTGRVEADARQKFMIFYTEDVYEKRWTNFTREGFELVNPVVALLPKWKQYIPDRYVLARLTFIPPGPQNDLVEPLSYEVIWVFQDANGEYLPPKFIVSRIVIDNLLGQVGKLKKYIDPTATEEGKEKQIDDLVKQLWGNETTVSDLLHYQEAVVVPGSFTKTEEKDVN